MKKDRIKEGLLEIALLIIIGGLTYVAIAFNMPQLGIIVGPLLAITILMILGAI